MQRRKIRNLNNTVFLTFLLLPFFKPSSLEFIAPTMESLFDYWRVASFAAIFLLYFLSGKASKMIIAISAYEVMLLVSTFINHGDYWRLVVNCGTVIGFCMLTELCVDQNSKKYFSTVFAIYLVLITINFIVLLFFPNGIAADSYYGNTFNFLGNDNSLAVGVSLPLMSVACISSAFKNRRLTFAAFLMIAMISATVLITWSATGVVAWFVMIAYILLAYRGWLTKYLNSYLLFTTFAVMQVAFVFLRLQEFFAFIIEDILGKSITFTGRTVMWDLAYLVILRSPIIGHGLLEGHGLIKVGSMFYYSHNAVLEVLIQSGAFGLILFIIPFVMAAKRLYQYREHFLAGLVSVTLFSFLMTFLMEAQISSIWIFGFLVIADHIPNIIRQCEANMQNQRMAFQRPRTGHLRIQIGR